MVYVDGSDCKEWLSKYIKESVIDIRALGYVEPSRSVVTVCTNHRPLRKVICALDHGKLIRDWAHHHMQWSWRTLVIGPFSILDGWPWLRIQTRPKRIPTNNPRAPSAQLRMKKRNKNVRWMSLIFFKPGHLPMVCRNQCITFF